MKIKNTLTIVVIILLFGCNKELFPKEECLQQFIEETQLILYEKGETLSGCTFFYELFEYQNIYYFSLGNYCVDMKAQITNCNRIDIIENWTSKKLVRFYAARTFSHIK